MDHEEVIATKSFSVYVFFTMGLIFVIAGIALGVSLPIELFYSCLIAAAGLALCLMYLKGIVSPFNLITKNGEYLILHTKKNKQLMISEIRDIKYRRERGRGISYSFGTITLIVNEYEEYKIRNATDVEGVGVGLSRLIYGNPR